MCRTKQQILCKHIRLINNRRAAKVVTLNLVLVIISKNHPNQKRIYTASTKEDNTYFTQKDILQVPSKYNFYFSEINRIFVSRSYEKSVFYWK